MNRFRYLIPKDAAEAKKATLAGGVLRAGGIDLLDRMKEGISAPEQVVSLRFTRPDSDPIRVGPEGGSIHASATLAELGRHEGVVAHFPALARASSEAATPQIRNRATVGGNLLQETRCWYYRTAEFTCPRRGGDHCPALLGENQYHAILGHGPCPMVHPGNLGPVLVALGATVEIEGNRTPRRVESIWPAADDMTRFHTLAPGEVLSRVILPPAGPNAYVEVRQRRSFDFPLAAAAVAKGPRGWRVVLGAVAPTPLRASGAEKILADGELTADRIRRAAAASVEGARPLSKNAYKTRLVRVAVARALTGLAGGEE